MGLDTSHDCWHGAYSAFMRWRERICEAAGLPPLRLMENFYAPSDVLSDPFYFTKQLTELERSSIESVVKELPISWDCLKPDPLYVLLCHSDCEGKIDSTDCRPLADSLEKLLPELEEDLGGHIGNARDKTQKFIDGLRMAANLGEDVEFH